VIEILEENGNRELQKDRKRKKLAAEIKKIKPLPNFFTASAQPEKDVEASVSTTPDIPVQVQTFVQDLGS
jgi:hypothetical protein